MNKVGAPKWGHWYFLDMILPLDIARHYKVVRVTTDKTMGYLYELKTDNPADRDIYSIIRTSKRCYRVHYIDIASSKLEAANLPTAYEVVDYMKERMLKKLNSLRKE